MKIRTMLTKAALAALVVGTTQASASPVLDWNQIAGNTIIAGASTRGPGVFLDFAVVHAAIHDVVQAYDKRFEPYAVDVQDAGGSLAAAVAKAAHDVLANRFPSQAGALTDIYNLYLADHGLAGDDPGVLVGAKSPPASLPRAPTTAVFPRSFRPS